MLEVTVTSFTIVELALPILVIKTFNSCLLKFIGKVTSVLSEVVPHCIYPIANQKTFASLLVKLVLKIADVDDMLPPKTIILTLVSVP